MYAVGQHRGCSPHTVPLALWLERRVRCGEHLERAKEADERNDEACRESSVSVIDKINKNRYLVEVWRRSLAGSPDASARPSPRHLARADGAAISSACGGLSMSARSLEFSGMRAPL